MFRKCFCQSSHFTNLTGQRSGFYFKLIFWLPHWIQFLQCTKKVILEKMLYEKKRSESRKKTLTGEASVKFQIVCPVRLSVETVPHPRELREPREAKRLKCWGETAYSKLCAFKSLGRRERWSFCANWLAPLRWPPGTGRLKHAACLLCGLNTL